MQAVSQNDFTGALVVKRIVTAPRNEVYRAFVEPETMKQWMGPGTVQCLDVTHELRVGGRLRVHMQSEEGDHIAVGEYLEIVPDERLVFTWSWETGVVKDTRVTVSLRDLGERTEIELLHEMLPEQDAVNKHTEGWTACLAQLAGLYA